MLDFIQCLPPIHPSFPSNSHRSPPEQISIPIFFSTVHNNSSNDRPTLIHDTKRWVGRCPGDPPRQLTVSDAPYSMHRKVLHRELSRHYPATTVEMCTSVKIKQQLQQKTNNREPLKTLNSTGTTVTSIPALSNVDGQKSGLFDALSKHVSIKAEPLRPVNNLLNSTTNALSSWQKYWTSRFTQRRRKEANDPESDLNRSKREQPLLATTPFVTVPDSPFGINREQNNHSRNPSPESIVCSPAKLSSSIVIDHQESFFYEESCLPLSRKVSPREQPSPMSTSRLIEEKPLSPIQSESALINIGNDILEHDVNTIVTKMYKLPLPSNKQKSRKTVPKQRRSRSKSLEKKPALPPTVFEKKHSITSLPNTFVSKRKHPILADQTPSNKPQRTSTKKTPSLATIITTTPRSKYERTKWDEPYVGARFDPPPPPCSPLLLVWHQVDDDAVFEQNPANEVYL